MRAGARAMLTAVIASASAIACGLSTRGTDGDLSAFLGDAASNGEGGAMNADGAVVGGGEGGVAPDGSAGDGGTVGEGGSAEGGTGTDAGGTKDAGPDGGSPCTGGVTEGVALTSLRLVGDATYDGANMRVDLTPANKNKAGAAWITTTLPFNATGSLSFDFVIPSSGTTGEGLSFAWVSTTGAAPTVGANGRNFGVCGGGMSNASGYGVVVDTDDGTHTTTLKIVNIILGSCTPIASASTSNSGAMSHVDNGQIHTLTVAWTSTEMSAILSGTPNLSANAIIAHPLTPLTLGFTAATGGSTSSLQSIQNVSWSTSCN